MERKRRSTTAAVILGLLVFVLAYLGLFRPTPQTPGLQTAEQREPALTLTLTLTTRPPEAVQQQDAESLPDDTPRTTAADSTAAPAPTRDDDIPDYVQAPVRPTTHEDLASVVTIVRTRRDDKDYRKVLLETAHELAARRRFVEAYQVVSLFASHRGELWEQMLAWDKQAYYERRILDRDAPYGSKRGLFDTWVGGGESTEEADQALRLSALAVLRDHYASLGPHQRSAYLHGVEYTLSHLVETKSRDPWRRAYMLSIVMDLTGDLQPSPTIVDSVASYANDRIQKIISGAQHTVDNNKWDYFDRELSRRTTVSLVAFERLSQNYTMDPALVEKATALLDTIEAKIGPLEKKKYRRPRIY